MAEDSPGRARSSDAPGARLAIDIGGTFTDVALEAGGPPVAVKVPTTPAAPENGVLAGVRKALDLAEAAPSEVRLIVHGTTLATNAIIERKGARTALIVTSGHRDALEMARENRFEQYDLSIDRAEPLVPRRLRLPVAERVDRNGRVRVPLEEASVRALLPTLDRHGVESVAVGLIHGYANPEHERRIGAILASERPELAVTLASEVCPEVREYERLSTACANAYVQPLMARYLEGLAASLTASGLDCPFLLMTSGGGLATLETALAAPVRLVESGPAGGAILASHLARRLELGDVLAFDMGGTTAKLCVIDGGRPLRSRAFEVARAYRFRKGSGLPVRIPVVEMVEIGAGGGSIAAVDDLGRIRVGPASAGSEPGPVAYGRGGAHPTVTDADVALGRIDPDFFAGGAIALDRARAAAAVRDGPGAQLGLGGTDAALAISEMADENVSDAARAHAAERGKGLAGRTLVAFGGSAPIHAARVADKLALDRFLVPTDAGVGSAVGFLLAPISYEVARSRYMKLSAFDAAAARDTLHRMREEAGAVVARGAPGAETVEVVRAYMRYVGQGHEIGVEAPRGIVEGTGAAAALRAAFDEAYRTAYGRVVPGLDVEVLSWTLAVTAKGCADDAIGGGRARNEGGPPERTSPGGPPRLPPAPLRRTELVDGAAGGPAAAAVHSRAGLGEGTRIEGPALVVETQTATVVPEGWEAVGLPGGHLLVRRIASAGIRASGRSSHRSRSTAPASADSEPDSAAPFLLRDQIVWSRLLSVAEEQARTLVRTAFSTPVREAGDLSAGVFDLSGRMLAQAVTGTPGHVNAMAESVGCFLHDHPVSTLVDGDVLVTNDPWEGTGHLNDFTVVTPAFVAGRAVALFAATSHIADVGGRGFGADANQVFEEGVRIPIGHLMRAGRIDRTLIRLIRANVRDPDVAQGDLHSLAACNRTGCERLAAMMAEFGLDALDRLAERIVSASRRAMLARIRALRPGTYRNRMRVDGYDRDLDLACALTVAPDGVFVDFDGTSPVSSRGINVPLAYTRAYASFGVRCVVGPEIPNNAGSLSAISVGAPDGSVLNAPPPAAVAARHAIGQMLPDVVLGCLEQAMEPGSVPAEGASCLWNPVLLGGPGLTGPHPYAGSEPFVVNPFHAGGAGARPGKDGLSATAFPSGVRSTPVEITETVAPLIFWKKEYIPDSGGAGEFRGGLGQIMEISHASGAPFAISKMFERVRNAARGRSGGGAGARGRVYVPGVGELGGKGREVVPPGCRVVLETPGGGGLGDPRRRVRARVLEDVRDGYVTPRGAAEDYGLPVSDGPEPSKR